MASAKSRRGAKRDRPTETKGLTPDLVVAAALELVDEVGVTGLTMRSLAQRLDTYPSTLYWHVGNRNEILARVFHLAMSGMDVPDPRSMRWDAWLRHAAYEYRAALHAHPNTAVLSLYPLVTAPAFVEAMLTALQRGGFEGPTLAAAFNAFSGSVAGWVAIELSTAAGEADQKWQAEFEERVRSLPQNDFPTITGNLPDLADEVFTLRWHGGAERPLDASFDAAVEVWMAGLAALRRRSRAT